MRITVRLPHSLRVAGVDAIRAVATLAEELGFYGVSVQDHILLDPGSAPCYTGDDDPRSVYSALSTLAYVASFTQTVKLVTTVVVAGYRHPVMLAKEAATIDALSGGRLILGFGVGASRTRQAAEGFVLSHHASIARREFDALGVKGNRGTLADETLQVLDAIWTNEAATFHGETVSFEDLDVFPKPVQRPRPPLLIGGRSEAALRRTALYADGWCPSHESPEHFAFGRSRILALAAEAGRPAPGWWGTNIDLAVATSTADAVDRMERGFGRLFETRQGMLNATLTGTPDEIVDRLAVWRRAGLNLADIKIVPRDLDETLDQMRLIGKEILPVLRELDS